MNWPTTRRLIIPGMLMRADILALLKVLIAASWADSRVSQAELNYVKDLAKRFHLPDEDWLELEPYLEDPPSDREVQELFRDLFSRMGTSGGRTEIIRHIEGLLNADAEITAEEHDFLEQYTAALREASTVDLLVRRVKTLFQKRPQAQTQDLEEFLRNKIQFKLRKRLGSSELTPETYRLCLIGGLMGIVA